MSANATNVTKPVIPTQARLDEIHCEMANSESQQKLIKLEGKLAPLTQKIVAAKVSFNGARKKYDKIRRKAADKQRRNFANEYLATRTEKVKIKARDIADRNYMDKYVSMYYIYKKMRDIIPLREDDITKKKKELAELSKHEGQLNIDITTGQGRAKALIAEIPLKKQEIDQAYTKRIIKVRKQDYLLAEKEAKKYDADAELEKALKPLRTMLVPMSKKIKSLQGKLHTLNATTTNNQLEIISSGRKVELLQGSQSMKVDFETKKLQTNQGKESAKKKSIVAAEAIRTEADKEAMTKKEIATKAEKMAKLETEKMDNRDHSAALALAQMENRKLTLQVAEKVAAASSAATSAENHKAAVVSAEKKVWAKKLAIVKASHGDNPADKTALKAALKAQKDLRSAQKKIRAEMPADPNTPKAKQAEKKKKDEQARKSKGTAKATAKVEKAAEQKAKDPLAKKP